MVKGYKEGQLRRLLGSEVCEILDHELGVFPAAAEQNIRRPDPNDPTGKKLGPVERAVVCRLYPRSDRSRIAFGLAGVECAQCIYIPQPDRDPADADIETVIDRGLYKAATQARLLLEQHDAGQDNRRVSGIVVP